MSLALLDLASFPSTARTFPSLQARQAGTSVWYPSEKREVDLPEGYALELDAEGLDDSVETFCPLLEDDTGH